jgi:hypothetical protein
LEPWDGPRAAQAIAEVDVLINVALAADPLTEARRLNLEAEKLIVRRLAEQHDPIVLTWPRATAALLARWRDDDGMWSSKGNGSTGTRRA